MSRTTNQMHDVVTTLRTMDPADRHVDAAGARARTDLEAILAVDPHTDEPFAGGSAAVGRTRRPARTTRRVALVGGAVAAVTAGLVVMPPLTGGDEAFATWTAAPQGVVEQERAAVAEDCREELAEGPGAGGEDAQKLSGAVPVIAERRGVWTTVLLTGSAGFSALCVTDDSAGLFTAGMIGSIGTPADDAAPGPRDLVATDLGAGTMGAGDISLVAGSAGAEVVAVVYRSTTHGEVVATVNGGYFALWFPGDELRDGATEGVQVEVSFRDGTSATAALTL